MTTDNLKIALTFIDSFNARNMDGWASQLAESFSASYPNAAGLDRAAARLYNESFMPAFPDLHFDVVRSHVAGDTVIIEWAAGGTHDGPLAGPGGQSIPPTGRRGMVYGVLVSEIRNGRIAAERTYWDQLGLMAQLGLLPQPA